MRLLLAIDTSAVSHTVVDHVAARPWPPGTEACVLHVVDPFLHGGIPPLISAAKQAAQAATELAVQALSRAGTPATVLITQGHPADSIVEACQQWRADFVFLGSRGASRIGRLLLGSTARSVVRRAPCSAAIIRLRIRPQQPLRVLLATDGSDCALAATDSVARRPWPAGTAFRVVSVPVFLLERSEAGYMDAAQWERLRKQAIAEADGYARAAVERLAAAGCMAESSVPLGFGGTSALLLDEAERWNSDLIVVGSHGRRGLDRLLLGSVSESVALHASCSVEIIR